MRLPALTRPFAALALLAVIAGCATPQYQTSIRLIPPADVAGRVCVQACEAEKTRCQTDCQARFQDCAKGLEPQIEAAYAEALKQYGIELKQYAAALRNYEWQSRFDWFNTYPYSPYFHPYWWDPWPRPYFPPPYAEPVLPTRADVRAQLEKTSCQVDCGCLPAYDGCFTGCGGQRVTDTLCIKNCPPAK